MANLIKFLKGTQLNLDALIKNGTATEGAFYLTNDTNRLYIGKKFGEDDNAPVYPVSVNQGVISVSTLDDLPGEKNNVSASKVPGEFYYVTGTTESPLNILCVYNGSTWVQVNPKYDDTEIQAAIEQINGGIATINGTIEKLQDEKADLTGATFTGKVYGVTPDDTDTDKTALVTRDYVDEAVSGLTGGKYATVEQLNEAVEDIGGDISIINQTLDLKASLADADFTKASIGGKAIATEEYADGVAETKANDAKEAILGDAETYIDLGKVEDKIALLEGADANLQGQIDEIKGNVTDLANVMAFAGVTTTKLENEATTSPITIDNKDYTPDEGDVVIYDGDEFVWHSGKWYQFGAADATNVIIQGIVDRLDDIDGETGEIARIDGILNNLAEADSVLNGEIGTLTNTVNANKQLFDTHVEAYNTYVTTNNAAVEQIEKDLSKAVEDLNKEDGLLAQQIATEIAAREQLAKDLEWGSF